MINKISSRLEFRFSKIAISKPIVSLKKFY